MSFRKQRHSSTTTTAARSSSAPLPPKPHEPPLKCPRCDSSNTKFCYYNNYNLSQPRYFCKTCRRYWTKGGALRNVPIGGGCRKNKKFNYSLKFPSSAARQTTSSYNNQPAGGLKFFQGLSTAMDFQIPAAPNTSPAILSTNSGPVVSSSPPCLTLDPLMGLASGFQEMGSVNFDLLNSLNQDLHWQLQQQRLAMLFLGENNQKENNNNSTVPSITTFEPSFTHLQKRQSIFFQELETPKKTEPDSSSPVGASLKDAAASPGVDRLLDNSYETVATSSSSNNMANEGTKNWSGIQPWIELTQYNNSLP